MTIQYMAPGFRTHDHSNMGCLPQPQDQSYKCSLIVNYDSKVVVWANFLSIRLRIYKNGKI